MTNWSFIVRTHGPMAFDTAWRLLGNVADVEDVLQEALLDAFRIHTREPVQNWGGLRRRLATRRSIDRLRRRRIEGPLPEDHPAEKSTTPEAEALERELAQRLRSEISQLPDREENVFSMHYFGDMTNPEIASALKITAGAVGVALHKARAKLKERLIAEDMAR